jgi:hypothetical protein
VSTTTEATQRRRESRKKSNARILRVQTPDRLGHARWITADVVDVSEGGIRIALLAPLTAGSKVVVRGDLGENQTNLTSPATVKWCTEKINGNFHAGLELGADGPNAQDALKGQWEAAEGPDWYEVMQLSPNADSETIARVYRILATRYHPDSSTGNQEIFLQLCEAHRVLSDPALRAKYDARHCESKSLRWKIFDRAALSASPEMERRKRRGILEALYAKALHDPEQATLSVFDFEELLGCPREHLEATLWYLRGKGYLKRGDNGRFAITVSGFDEVEGPSTPRENHRPKLLETNTGL